MQAFPKIRDSVGEFQPDRYGATAIASAAKWMLDDGPPRRIRVLIARHPKSPSPDAGEVKTSFEVGIGDVYGAPCVRICGEGGPNGDGSHSLIHSGLSDSLDPVNVATHLAMEACRQMRGVGPVSGEWCGIWIQRIEEIPTTGTDDE